MCGITGYFRHQDESADVSAAVQVMNDALVHRGPDSEGIWCNSDGQDANLALGHRRLSIIDLSPAGAQPMVSASGRYIIVFNGEIYNFQIFNNRIVSLSVRYQRVNFKI